MIGAKYFLPSFMRASRSLIPARFCLMFLLPANNEERGPVDACKSLYLVRPDKLQHSRMNTTVSESTVLTAGDGRESRHTDTRAGAAPNDEIV